ncbi:MAG: hypothetical protein US18_C0019G0003 [Parcubacteria group bacterium GW2011_GWB1_36_5]|nr:MAG: hypothetical protein US18_C0019G0003 [Parcubacteria group bacterium GW2011_GWB1_36_5]
MKEFSSGQSQFDVRKPEYLESDYFKDPASFKLTGTPNLRHILLRQKNKKK